MQALQSFIQEGLGNINKGQDKVSSDLMLIKRSLQDLPNTFHSSSPSSLKKTPIKKKKKETVPEGKTCGVNVIDSWDCLIENKKGAIGKEIQIPDFNLDMSLSNVIEPEQSLNLSKNFLSKEKKNVRSFVLESETLTRNLSGMQGESGVRVKEFDEFKELLKDINLSLNISQLSINEQPSKRNSVDLKALLMRYKELDQEIEAIAKSRVEGSLLLNISKNSLMNKDNVDECKSLNLGKKEQSAFIQRLKQLKKRSKLKSFELEATRYQISDDNDYLFCSEVEEDLNRRKREFEELKEFLI